MKKIEIAFDTSFENDSVIPLSIGRLVVGGHYSVRMQFHTDGTLKLVIPQEAIDAGAVIVSAKLSEAELSILGLEKFK